MSAFNEKTNFFGLPLLIFLGLQIYEGIAAIFWQSAAMFVRCFHNIFLTLIKVAGIKFP